MNANDIIKKVLAERFGRATDEDATAVLDALDNAGYEVAILETGLPADSPLITKSVEGSVSGMSLRTVPFED